MGLACGAAEHSHALPVPRGALPSGHGSDVCDYSVRRGARGEPAWAAFNADPPLIWSRNLPSAAVAWSLFGLLAAAAPHAAVLLLHVDPLTPA
jgi:hypothetical protein